MSNKTEVRNGGLGFFSILTLIFITLKLTGFIAWSWWWVLFFIWFPALITIVVLIIIAIVAWT